MTVFKPTYSCPIPDGATITAAVLYLYCEAVTNDDNDGDDWLNVVGETSQDDPTTIIVQDFDTCGAVDNPIGMPTAANRLQAARMTRDRRIEYPPMLHYHIIGSRVCQSPCSPLGRGDD